MSADAWRTLATAQGFPVHLQHATGAELEQVAPEVWQLCYAGKAWEHTGRFAPCDWAEGQLSTTTIDSSYIQG